MTTIITREMKESLIERIIANSSYWIDSETYSIQVLTELMLMQNFLIRNINYHGVYHAMDKTINTFTCVNSNDLNSLCEVLNKINETLKTEQDIQIFDKNYGYIFGELTHISNIVKVVHKNNKVYTEINREITQNEKEQLTDAIQYMLWIIGNWKKDNRII